MELRSYFPYVVPASTITAFEEGLTQSSTDEEVLAKAEARTMEILNNIASVTLDREARQKTERFEDIEIII